MFFGSEAPVQTEFAVSKTTAVVNSFDSHKVNSRGWSCAIVPPQETQGPFQTLPSIHEAGKHHHTAEQLARNKLNWREISLICQKVMTNGQRWGSGQNLAPWAPL